ncbi:MAG: hypothetical protein E4H28_08230 [Gemmatimonadales bacterium]|nr:MAG: hypothetical protein E4H28_08230 [Gemmatimonadales bacterium]
MAYLYVANVSTSPTFSCAASSGSVQSVRDDTLTISATDMSKFTAIESIRIASNWFQQNAGFNRHRVAVVHVSHTNSEHAGFDLRLDFIVLAEDALYYPLSAIHEYGHALQFALAGYQTISYGQYQFLNGFVSGPYGIIAESAKDGDTFANTAFAEGWAVFFNSAVSEGWAYEQAPGVRGSSQCIEYVRSSQFLDDNSFWMGADAYQYPNDISERWIAASNLSNLYDGTNNNASKGELVLGGIASIFWDIHKKLGGLQQLREAIENSQYLPAKSSDLWALHDALIDQKSDRLKRAMDAIFIDHGVAVA